MASEQSHRQFGQTFDQAAEAYDKVRSGYPRSLIAAAMERGDLAAGSRVVEVGCGTGKLTELLAEQDLLVDAVDPGRNMIAVARKRVSASDSVEFHIGKFEDVELPEAAFDAVFSATAFHWVDPEVGWSKAASHLKPDGLLALLSHISLRDEESAAVHDALLDVLRVHAPEIAAGWPDTRELDAVLAGIPARCGNASEMWDWLMSDGQHRMAVGAAAELYYDVDVATEVSTIEETADDLIALFRTTSLYHRLDPDKREALMDDDRRVIERFGGTISSTMAAVLMTAKRTPPG
jgi:SAM-dependent methyltransferase